MVANWIHKCNIKSGLLSLAVILIIFGIILIIKDIKDVGTIDLKTPLLTGKISSGFVGVTLLFFSVILCGFACYISALNIKNATQQEIKIVQDKDGKLNIIYTGKQNIPSGWEDLSSAIKNLFDSMQNKRKAEEENKNRKDSTS